jgi:hypothetical protein
MRLHSSTYPELTLALPEDQTVQFHGGYADVDDELGAVAVEHGGEHGVQRVADGTGETEAGLDPSSWPSTFGFDPANPALPSAATTDVGGPGTAPGTTAVVGDLPPGFGPAAPPADQAPVTAAEIPDPLPEDLTELPLDTLKALAARHGVDAKGERAKKGVIALLPERALLDAGAPSAPTSPNPADGAGDDDKTGQAQA